MGKREAAQTWAGALANRGSDRLNGPLGDRPAGTARLGALFVSGAWRRSPCVRMVLALGSGLFWLQISLRFVSARPAWVQVVGSVVGVPPRPASRPELRARARPAANRPPLRRPPS